jgi:hypothetical protein
MKNRSAFHALNPGGSRQDFGLWPPQPGSLSGKTKKKLTRQEALRKVWKALT